jgi:hypothetical protein
MHKKWTKSGTITVISRGVNIKSETLTVKRRLVKIEIEPEGLKSQPDSVKSLRYPIERQPCNAKSAVFTPVGLLFALHDPLFTGIDSLFTVDSN